MQADGVTDSRLRARALLRISFFGAASWGKHTVSMSAEPFPSLER